MQMVEKWPSISIFYMAICPQIKKEKKKKNFIKKEKRTSRNPNWVIYI